MLRRACGSSRRIRCGRCSGSRPISCTRASSCMLESAEVAIPVGAAAERVSGLLLRPPQARLIYVLAHGAGAGMRHPFLEAIARQLAERGIGTLRYQFPYMERRARRPDPPPVAEAAVRAARQGAPPPAPRLPLAAAGQTFGGPS